MSISRLTFLIQEYFSTGCRVNTSRTYRPQCSRTTAIVITGHVLGNVLIVIFTQLFFNTVIISSTVSEVDISSPVDTFRRSVQPSVTDCSTNTLVHLLTDITQAAAHTGRKRHTDGCHQWVCQFVVTVKSYVETVVEHTQVQTNILIQCLLPFQIWVTESIYQDTGTKVIQQPVIELISGKCVVSTKVLVTWVTDRSSDLEHREEVGIILNKRFVMNIPSQTYSPSSRELLV